MIDDHALSMILRASATSGDSHFMQDMVLKMKEVRKARSHALGKIFFARLA